MEYHYILNLNGTRNPKSKNSYQWRVVTLRAINNTALSSHNVSIRHYPSISPVIYVTCYTTFILVIRQNEYCSISETKDPVDVFYINHLTPKDPYMGRTAPLNSKRCILYIYSTNVGTEYLNMLYTLRFFSSKCSLFHNSNLFDACIIHILYTECAKIKKKNSGAKGLISKFKFRIFPSTCSILRTREEPSGILGINPYPTKVENRVSS